MPSRRNASGDARRSGARHGVARALSKRGFCSRTQAAALVTAGRVRVNGRLVLDPEHPVTAADAIAVDGCAIAAAERVVLMLNKPRGLVTTARDERGRDTVYACLQDAPASWLGPVGRLDKASEGLLLFTNDPAWAASVTDPTTGPDKTYHVQVDVMPDAALAARLERGVDGGGDGERLAAKSVRVLRVGERRGWLEIVLDEGRNRQIRRLLEACGIGVVRLLRVAIGPVELGALPKGAWRPLTAAEVETLVPTSATSTRGRRR